MDIAAIHTNNQLQRIVTTVVSYGYFGDLLRSSESLRCLGPSRYFLSGMQQILRNPSYPVTIRFRQNKHHSIYSEDDFSQNSFRSTASCNSICSVCSNFDGDIQERPLINNSVDNDSPWREVRSHCLTFNYYILVSSQVWRDSR